MFSHAVVYFTNVKTGKGKSGNLRHVRFLEVTSAAHITPITSVAAIVSIISTIIVVILSAFEEAMHQNK
jgi:hypothetical protein